MGRLTLIGWTLHPGKGAGQPLALDSALSFWGGTDASGVIVDEHHPQRGARLVGRVLIMPAVCGSSSSSSVLAEHIRTGTAPAALVLGEPDAILIIGAWVAAELYGRSLPIVVLPAAELAALGGWPSGPVTVVAGTERATIDGPPSAPSRE